MRLHGQAVKTSPFHGGNPGSIPGGVTKKRRTRFGVRLFLVTPPALSPVFKVSSLRSDPLRMHTAISIILPADEIVDRSIEKIGKRPEVGNARLFFAEYPSADRVLLYAYLCGKSDLIESLLCHQFLYSLGYFYFHIGSPLLRFPLTY